MYKPLKATKNNQDFTNNIQQQQWQNISTVDNTKSDQGQRHTALHKGHTKYINILARSCFKDAKKKMHKIKWILQHNMQCQTEIINRMQH